MLSCGIDAMAYCGSGCGFCGAHPSAIGKVTDGGPAMYVRGILVLVLVCYIISILESIVSILGAAFDPQGRYG